MRDSRFDPVGAQRERMSASRNEMDFQRNMRSADLLRPGQYREGQMRTEAGGWGQFFSGLKKAADDAKAAGMDFAINPASSVVNDWAAQKQAQQQAMEQADQMNQAQAQQPSFEDMQKQRLAGMQERAAGYEAERNQEAASRQRQEAVGRMNARGPKAEPEKVVTNYGKAAQNRMQQAPAQRAAMQNATQMPGFMGRW